MTLDELQALALSCWEARDPGPLDAALIQAIGEADPETIWAALCLDGMGDIHGDAELPTPVVSAIVDRALAVREPATLAIAIRMSHFHCAALVCGDIRKAQGQRALSAAQDGLRAAWDPGRPRLGVTVLHALAASEVFQPSDQERLTELLEASDPEVQALAVMIHAAVGDADRDALLSERLHHASPLVRLWAALGLAREGGRRPLPQTVVDVLQHFFRAPVPLPAWWMFRWVDGPETADDLAERMLEEAGHTVSLGH